MGPYFSQRALKNLRKGIKKVDKNMSPAARVRQQFRVGRPAKGTLPLHPVVVWQRATEQLAHLKQMMVDAGLKASDVDGQIVAIHGADEHTPRFIGLTDEKEALKLLSRMDVIALGMVFRQHDSELKKDITFSWNLAGLTENGMAVMKRAVEAKLTKSWN